MSTPDYQLFNSDPTMMNFGGDTQTPVNTDLGLTDPTLSNVFGGNNSNIGQGSSPQFQNPTISTPVQNPSITPPTTGSNDPGSTYGTPSTWQQILSGVTGGQTWQGALGSALPYGLAAGVGLLQAKGAQNQTQSEVNQIMGASAPYLQASQSFLKQYQSQTLTPLQKQYVDWTSAEAQDLINSGQAAKTIAQTNFADYASGTLKPADQAALDQQTQAQKASVAQMLANTGSSDSSVLAAYNQQIDTQALINKQTTLNSYFQTGDQAYNTWLNSTAEGIQVKTLGAQFAQSAFAELLQASLGFGAIGMQGLTTAIGLQIQSDAALSSEVGNLMQNLMSAYALQSGLKAMGSGGQNILGGAQNIVSQLLGAGAPASVANFNNAFASSGIGSTAAGSAQIGSDFQSAMNTEMAGLQTPAGSVEVGIPGDYGGDAAAQVASDAQSTNNAAFDAWSSGEAGATDASGAASGISDLQYGMGALGIAGGAYDLYKNWESGDTFSDTRGGAELGAGIGSVIPGVGTLLGAGVGAAVGAVSSLFGPGKKDPETQNWDSYAAAFDKSGAAGVKGATPAQNYQMLAGIFDARGSNIPFYQKYGRMGEGKFMSDMAGQINTAIKSGKISKTASASQIYSQVVQPWINSMSKGGWQNTSTSKGAAEKPAIQNLLTSIIQQYQQGDQSKFTGINGQASPITTAYGS